MVRLRTIIRKELLVFPPEQPAATPKTQLTCRPAMAIYRLSAPGTDYNECDEQDGDVESAAVRGSLTRRSDKRPGSIIDASDDSDSDSTGK